jgi:hypothetical protein
MPLPARVRRAAESGCLRCKIVVECWNKLGPGERLAHPVARSTTPSTRVLRPWREDFEDETQRSQPGLELFLLESRSSSPSSGPYPRRERRSIELNGDTLSILGYSESDVASNLSDPEVTGSNQPGKPGISAEWRPRHPHAAHFASRFPRDQFSGRRMIAQVGGGGGGM